MSDTDESKNISSPVLVEQFREIMEKDPELFCEHPELLECVKIPDHQNEGVASLFEKQAQVLRDRISVLNRSSTDMVKAARENELISDRLFHVIFELLAANDLDSLLCSLYSSLQEKFGVERVTLKVSASSDSPGIAEIDPAHSTSKAYVETLAMVKNHSHCDERLPARLLEYLFGGNNEEIKSVALIPLLTSPRGGAPIGLLALGSGSKQQFQPGLGTVHLDRLGMVLGAFIERHLDEAAN
jgi:uncharacterized protein YigA (DUF484 family)